MVRKQNESPQRVKSLFLAEFLQVAITSIVFLKGIYPIGAFERRRYMNLVVHRARHPQLHRYIHDSLNALVPYFEQGMIERVVVILFNNDKVPVEKFVFKINVNMSNDEMMEDDADLESSLRSFLIKLSQSEPLSKASSQDWRWEITAYFCSLPSENRESWIPTQALQWQQPPLITPIKSINTDPLSVQLYLEHPSLLERLQFTTMEKHVAVYTFPYSSHPHLLLTLTRRLASAAPTVVFSFFNIEKSNRVLFSNLSCSNILRYDVSDGIPEGYVFQGKPQEDVNLFLAVAEEELRRGVRVAERDTGLRISCLVVDAFFWFCGEMAEEMNIPWVAFWTAGTCSLAAHVYTDQIREKSAQLIDSVGTDEEIVDLIPGLKAVRVGDLPSGVVLGNLKSPFSTMLHKMGRALAKATAVPINSFQELDPDLTKDLSSKLKNFLNIGPFNLISKEKTPLKSDEHSCISWLDNQNTRAVAYISFGTVFTPPPHELVALAEALEETKTPFLWSLNKDSYKHFPKGFLERANANGTGKVVAWAPQDEVLNHVAIGVFVTHGGWNSVLESIGAGVPMICRPFLGDQHINSWMVERVWEIGRIIEGGSFTKHTTCCVLEHVLSRRYERIETLKDLAHKAVALNGSSNQNFKALVELVTGQPKLSVKLLNNGYDLV
ncbi:hypothetical protein QVD17_01323 [Tagetes erecta]|uniref:HORMA domain-containing protein n=1 Tax=Tagetes erecta TaxID=13708 RepID=A0AAD8P809_TARER|nr:hypothetical protein QVD17_01323 [Tagetes erecta]